MKRFLTLILILIAVTAFADQRIMNGPASTTDGAIVVMDGTTGKLTKTGPVSAGKGSLISGGESGFIINDPGTNGYIPKSDTSKPGGIGWIDPSTISGSGSDTTAIHDNTSGEISAVTEKETPVAADMVLIEDSASSNAKKMVELSNIPKSFNGVWNNSIRVFNVMAYGAVGDNSTDNTTALTNAINAANAALSVSAVGGGTTLVPPGVLLYIPDGIYATDVLPYIMTDVYGPGAWIKASSEFTTNERLLQFANVPGSGYNNQRMVRLAGVIGAEFQYPASCSDCSSTWENFAPVGSGVTFGVAGSLWNWTVDIGLIAGFVKGVEFNTDVLATICTVTENKFNFMKIAYNDYGIYMYGGDTAEETGIERRIECNQLNINYMVLNEYAIYADADRADCSSSQECFIYNNSFYIQSLETHQAYKNADNHGIYFKGEDVNCNKITIADSPHDLSGMENADTQIEFVAGTNDATYNGPYANVLSMNAFAFDHIITSEYTIFVGDTSEVGTLTSESIKNARTRLMGDNYPPNGRFASSNIYWTEGDIIYNDSPSDGTLMWICTTSGQDSASAWTAISTTGGGAGSDTTAIHDNVSAEISAITEKASPVAADKILIEDSAASNAKKMVQLGNISTTSTTQYSYVLNGEYPLDSYVEGLWDLDGGLTDRSGNSHTLTNDGAVAAAGHDGETDSAYDLEHANGDSLSVADTAALSITGSLSLFCWVKIESHTNGNYPLVKTGSYRIYMHTNGVIYFGLTANGTDWTEEISAGAVSAGVWTHIGCVFDTSTNQMRVYINGVLSSDGSPAEFTGTIADSAGALTVGIGAAVGYYDGVIDDIVIHSRALSADEVYNLYIAGDDFSVVLNRKSYFWRLNIMNTSDLTLTSSDAGILQFTSIGSLTADRYINLPAFNGSGNIYIVTISDGDDTYDLRIDPSGTNKIIGTSAAGDYLAADDAGDTIEIVDIYPGYGSVISKVGTWTEE